MKGFQNLELKKYEAWAGPRRRRPSLTESKSGISSHDWEQSDSLPGYSLSWSSVAVYLLSPIFSLLSCPDGHSQRTMLSLPFARELFLDTYLSLAFFCSRLLFYSADMDL